MTPGADAKDVANITSLITCGYSFGSDNSKIIERFYGLIIDQVNEFLEGLTAKQKMRLPNGVMNRLTTARKEALEYRAKLLVELGANSPDAEAARKTAESCHCAREQCRCYLRGGSCAACADCD